jgi:hypothetical protein
MDNQHQTHMGIHNTHHQMHMDIHNSAVNSQTTFHSEPYSAHTHNDFSSDKHDSATGFTSSGHI